MKSFVFKAALSVCFALVPFVSKADEQGTCTGTCSCDETCTCAETCICGTDCGCAGKCILVKITKTDGTVVAYKKHTKDDKSIVKVTKTREQQTAEGVDAVQLEDAGVFKVEILPGREAGASEQCKVTYTRKFNTTNVQAWCVPFSINHNNIPADVVIGKFVNFDLSSESKIRGIKYHLINGETKYDKVAANLAHAVYVKTPKEYTFEGEKIEKPKNSSLLAYRLTFSQDYSFAFYANYENQGMKEKKGVFISAGEFTYTTSDKAVLSPYRCYINISEITDTEETDNGTKYTYGEPQEPSVFFNGHMANSTSMFIYDMDYEGMTTGVESLTNKEGESANHIGRQNVSHDLSGRAVSKSTKGLYIANGKKIIVK